MITFLRGDFVYKTPALIHVDVQGVGYEVQISLHTFSQMQHLDKGLLHIYHQVKEDNETLFGCIINRTSVCYTDTSNAANPWTRNN